MTFYIRPRQDFSLARFSKVMRILHLTAIKHEPVLFLDTETARCEYRIALPFTDNEDRVKVIVDWICEDTDCNPSDFKIIEVKE